MRPEGPSRGRRAEGGLRLEGLARNCSCTPRGGISPQPLTELVPLYKTNRDEIVTQFDMNGLEKLSLLKMGFPGADDAHADPGRAAVIRKRHGVELVPEDLPLTTRRPTRSSPRASPAACSSSNRAACATSCGATSPAASKT